MDGLILIKSDKALIPHSHKAYCYQYSHSVEAWAYKPSKTTIKRWHLSEDEKKGISSNPQSTVRTLKTILKYH
jgi:hypothetical protein